MELSQFSKLIRKHLFKQRLFFSSIVLIGIASFSEIVLALLLALLASDRTYFESFSLVISMKEKVVLICGVVFIKIVVTFFLQSFTAYIQRSLLQTFSSTIYARVISEVDMNLIHKKGIGYFWGLAGDESYKLSSSISNMIPLLGSVCMLIACLGMLGYTSFSGFLFFIGFVLLSFIFGKTLSGKIREYGIKQADLSRSANTVFADGVNNIKALRSLTTETYITNKYSEKLSEYTQILIKNDITISLLKFIPSVFIIIVFISFAWTATDLALGEYLATAFLFFRALPLAGSIYNTYLRLISDLKSVKDISSLLENEYKTEDQMEELTQGIQDLRFENLTIGYEGLPIIQNFSAFIKAGQVLGIRGRSGVGKSTLFDVLLKYKSPLAGNIFINGISISGIDKGILRKNIRLVEQGYSVFSDTFKNNISLGREVETSFLTILLNEFNFQEYLNNLNTYDLTYGGTNLSGGQKQRLSIIRGIIDRPKVLILDESFAGLDASLRNKIFLKVKEIMKNGILIIISHEESVLDLCDSIIDMNMFSVAKSENLSS